jgi:hypothetical protein
VTPEVVTWGMWVGTGFTWACAAWTFHSAWATRRRYREAAALRTTLSTEIDAVNAHAALLRARHDRWAQLMAEAGVDPDVMLRTLTQAVTETSQ